MQDFNTIIFNEEQNYVEIVYEGLNTERLNDLENRVTQLELDFNNDGTNDSGRLDALDAAVGSLNSLTQATTNALLDEISEREGSIFTLSENFANDIIATQQMAADAIEAEVEARAAALLAEASARGAAIASSSAIIMTDVAILATTVGGLAAEMGAAQASIIIVQDALVTETEARTAQYTAIQADFTDTNAAVLEETVVRANADEALAYSISILEATAVAGKTFHQATAPADPEEGWIWYDSDDSNKSYRWNGTTWVLVDSTQIAVNTAAVASEALARATADSALASDITTVTASVAGNTAAIASEASTRATNDTALASSITALTSTVGTNTAAISSEATTRASADTALASSITTLTSSVGTNTAAITTEASTRAAADTSISGKYSVKIDLDGNVSGFDLISTANVNATPLSTFNFRSDVFNIYNGTSALPPFSIVGGVVYMANVKIGTAVIDDLAITTGKIADNAVSNAYSNSADGPVTESISIGSGGSVWHSNEDVHTIVVPATSSPMIILWGCRVDCVRDVGVNLQARLMSWDTAVPGTRYERGLQYNQDYFLTFDASFNVIGGRIDVPASSSVTYAINLEYGLKNSASARNADFSTTQMYIIVLELKK